MDIPLMRAISMREKRARGRESGFALALAMWMLAVLSVLILGSIASALKENQQATEMKMETRSRVLATSAIYRAFGHIIDDRAQNSDSGVILTEINFYPYVQGEAIKINGFYVNGALDRICVYNAGSASVNLIDFGLDDDVSFSPPDVPLSGTLAPGTAKWFTGDFDAAAATITLYKNSAGWTATSESWTHAAVSNGERHALLPDGGVDLNLLSTTKYWVKSTPTSAFQHIPATDPGAVSSETNGIGIWMDDHTVKRYSGTSGTADRTFTFPNGRAFLRYGKSLILVNANTTTVTGGETYVRTGTDSVPWIDHAAASADSVAFILFQGGTSLSVTGSLDFKTPGPPTRYKRTTDAGAMTTGGGMTPGTPDGPGAGGAYTSLTPILSEVNDETSASGSSTAKTLFFSEYGEGSSTNRWLEIYNGTGVTVDYHDYWIHARINGGTSYAKFRIGPAAGLNVPTGTAYVIAYTGSSAGILANSDTTSNNSAINYNGDDAISLVKNTSETVDVVGLPSGPDPGTGWAVAGTANATVDRTLIRKATVDSGAGIAWTTSAGTTVANSQWTVMALDDTSNLGLHSFGVGGGAGAISGNEFVEISLGAATVGGADTSLSRRREFIEIFNTDAVGHGMSNQDYWISVGSGTAANKRYLHPLFSTSDTLASYKFGIIVAADFTTADAAALGLTLGPGSTFDTNLYSFYGLGPIGGPALDLNLGVNGGAPLSDSGAIVVIGYGGGPAPPALWYGAAFAQAGLGGVTWQKANYLQPDDVSSPYTDWNPTPMDNWDTSGGQNNGDAGRGNNVSGAVDAYDVDPWISKDRVWQDSDGVTRWGGGGYMRYEVFDEAGKISYNSPQSLLWRGMTYNSRSGYYNAAFPDVAGAEENQTATDIYNLGGRKNPKSSWLTTEHTHYIWNSGAPSGQRSIHRNDVPVFSAYSPRGANSDTPFHINVHYALRPGGEDTVLIAGLATCKGINAAMAQSIAVRIRAYVLGADLRAGGTLLNADKHYNNVNEIWTMTPALLPAEITALSTCSLGDTFSVQSNNFFTIVGTGAIFEGGVLTGDTLSQRMSMAVVRRNTSSDKGIFVFWRNNWDDGVTYYK